MAVHVSRTFGGLTLNDRVRTFYLRTEPRWDMDINVMIAPGSGGLGYLINYDSKPAIILATGLWRDDHFFQFRDFWADLHNEAGGALDLGYGWTFAKAVVADVTAKCQIDSTGAPLHDSGTKYLQVWDWTVTFAAYNG